MNSLKISEELEEYLKTHVGLALPAIVYFNGTESFSNVYGMYTSKSLLSSYKLWLDRMKEEEAKKNESKSTGIKNS